MKIKYIEDHTNNKIQYDLMGSTKNYKNKNFALLGGYEKTYGAGQRTWRVARAIAATLFFGLGLFSQKIRSDLGLLFQNRKVVLVYSSHPSVVAANNGEASGQFSLAEMFSSGVKGKTSAFRASFYYALAAKQGHNEAHRKLSSIFSQRDKTIEVLQDAAQVAERLVKLGALPVEMLDFYKDALNLIKTTPGFLISTPVYIDIVNKVNETTKFSFDNLI